MENLRNTAYRLLRRSESFFKTDMVYLTKGGFWLTLVQAITAVTLFALSVAFANLFAKDDYGYYRYVIAIAGVIGTISLTGLGQAVTQSVARGFDGALTQGFKENLRWSGGIILISAIGSLYYYFNDNALLALSLLIIGATTPILNSSSLFGPYLNGKKDFRALAFLSIFRVILPAVALVTALLIKPTPLVVIFTYFISHATSAFIAYKLVLKRKLNSLKDENMVAYAKHLSFIGILNTLADQADKIIVFHFIGAAPLAVYSFATALPLQIKGILKGLSSLAMPKFAERDLEETKKHLPKKMVTLFGSILLIVVLYILAAPSIYRFFFPQYIDAIFMSQIFSLSLLGFISIIPFTLLQAKKNVDGIYKTNIIMAIIKLTSLFAGLMLWGLWGIIFARIFIEYTGILVTWIYTRKQKL